MATGTGKDLGGPWSSSGRTSARYALVSTLGVIGVTWFLCTHEPFASKMEPLTSMLSQMTRGSKVPTVPRTAEPYEGSTQKVAPKADSPHTGVVGGDVEGRKIRSASLE